MKILITDSRYHGPNRDKFKGRYKVVVRLIEDEDLTFSPLDEFLARVQSVLGSIPEERRRTAKVYFGTREDYDCHAATWGVYYHREETDEEVAARIANAEAEEQARANARRAEYERLRKEFEGGAK